MKIIFPSFFLIYEITYFQFLKYQNKKTKNKKKRKEKTGNNNNNNNNVPITLS